MFIPVLLDLARVPVNEVGVWVVKVLLEWDQVVVVPFDFAETASGVSPASSTTTAAATTVSTAASAIATTTTVPHSAAAAESVAAATT